MKKTLKAFSALTLTLVLLFALAVPAYAADTYKITITNPTAGYTYEAYQVFSGTLSANEEILSNITWGSGVNGTNLLAALKGNTTVGSLFTSATTAAHVAAAMNGLGNDSEQAKIIADIVGQHLSTATGTSTAGSGNYTIANLPAGYYLVKNLAVPGTDGAYTRFILEVVDDVTVSPKAGIPTVTKKVQENVKSVSGTDFGTRYNDVADYSIGDSVPFKLIGTLPSNYDAYKTYQYIFADTLSIGLTYNEDSAKVYVDGTEILTGFTVNGSGQTLTVTFSNLKAVTGVTITKDSKITVEYTATLNASAVIGGNGNINEVDLTYSNNPNTGGSANTAKTPKDKVIVFTYGLDVTKVDGADTSIKLPNAKFRLYKMVDDVKNYAVVVNGKITGWTTTEASGTELVSAATTGRFSVAGLDDGTYYLDETQAPDGYNDLVNDITLVITATTVNNQTWNGTPSAALTALTVTADGVSGTCSTSTGVVSVTVANNKGSTLPSTGGIGTTIFYIVGGALTLGAAILLITKKRIANKG